MLQQIAPLINHGTITNNALTAEKQLLKTLRFLGTNAFYSVIGHAHGMDKRSVSRAIHQTVKALNAQIFQNIVKWPDIEASRKLIAERFYAAGGMPSIGGAIDGSHIPIERLKE